MEQDLTTAGDRWPRLSVRSLEAGYRSVHALPMRLQDTTIGALNLFRTEKGAMDEYDVAAAQGFADVATIAIFQQRATNEAQFVNERLRHVMNGRIIVEQAKGWAKAFPSTQRTPSRCCVDMPKCTIFGSSKLLKTLSTGD